MAAVAQDKADQLTKMSVSLPEELNYRLPSSKRSMIQRRDELSRNATGTSTGITPNSTVVFEIPPASNRVLDSRQTYFSFRVVTSNAADRLGGPCHNLINRVRILTDNGSVLEDIPFYNVINRAVQYTHFSDNYLDEVEAVAGYEQAENVLLNGVLDVPLVFADNAVGFGAIAAGSDLTDANLGDGRVAANRNFGIVRPWYRRGRLEAEQDLTGGRTFFFRLEASGILNSDRMFPLMVSGLRVEIILESNAQGLRVSTGGYTISDPKIYYTSLQLSDQVAATLSESIRKGKLYLPYSTFAHKNGTVNGTSINVDFTQALYRVSDMFITRRLVSAIDTSGQDGFNFVSCGTGSNAGFQLRYNDQFIPVEFCQGAERSYMQTKASLGQLGSVLSDCLPYHAFTLGGRFVLVANMATLMSDGVNSGVSTKNSRSINADVRWSSSENSRVDVFCHYMRVMSIDSSGVITILE